MIIGHPSQAGMASGTGLSGSTDCSTGSARECTFTVSRRRTAASPTSTCASLISSTTVYVPPTESITLRWENGLFVPERKTNSVEKLAEDHEADQIFLTVLDRFERSGRNLSAKLTAGN